MNDSCCRRDTERFVYAQLTEEQLATYDEQGYLVLGRTLTDRGLDDVRRECMTAWSAEKEAFDCEKTWLQNSLLPNIHHRSKVARDYYFYGPLVDAAVRLIGPNIKGATTQLTFKLRGNIMPFAWHQDNGYGELEPYNAISTLTALGDADETNGCLWVVPGSHREKQVAVEHTIEQKATGAAIELEVDESRAIPVPVRAGECLILNCWMLHKSEGNRSRDRDRRVLFMRYADADAVEVYNDRQPRLGRLLRGTTKFPEVESFEAELA